MSIDQRLRNGLHPGPEPDLDTLAALRRVEQRAARQTRNTRLGVGLLVAAAVALMVGVGAALPREARTDRADVVAVQPPGRPLEGTYVVDVPDSQVGRSQGLVGRWVISLEADGALKLRPPPAYAGATTGAAWRVEGELLRTDALVEPGCQADNGYVGTYRWSLTDDLLVFSLVDDACEVRRALFTGPGWERVP